MRTWPPKFGKADARLLVVDDSPDIVELVGTMLSSRGYEVSGVSSGAEALSVIDVVRPQLVFLDISMPEMDGFDVLARLRARPSTQDLPIIMLSGHRDEPDIRRALGLGAKGYVVKPFTVADLVGRIKQILTAPKASQG